MSHVYKCKALLNAGRAQARDILEAQDALLSARLGLNGALVAYAIARLELMRDLVAEPSATTIVGDSLRDLEAGRAAGARSVLVRTGNGTRTEASARAAGFSEVYDDLKAFAAAEIDRNRAIDGAQQ